jgi:hypothetical protein
MEFVVVNYYRKRNVFMDGSLIGKTGDTLLVQEGTHRFDLGEPKNYAPTFRKAQVTGTIATAPRMISFSPVEVAS